MLPFHKWMHEKAFYLHHIHHKNTKTVTAYSGAYFDVTDIFIENAGGIIVGTILANFLVGRPLSLLTFLLVMWHDMLIHSVNPYCPVYWNPLADYIFRGTVAHNVHHVLLNCNYLLFPFHHIFSDKRQEDIRKYNEEFGTKIY